MEATRVRLLDTPVPAGQPRRAGRGQAEHMQQTEQTRAAPTRRGDDGDLPRAPVPAIVHRQRERLVFMLEYNANKVAALPTTLAL
jgi:hypothetical protein